MDQSTRLIEVVKSKLHKARLTGCLLDYEGSLEIDEDLLDKVGMLPYEKILVVNATNGERLVTYAIPGERGSGVMCLNGAAARRGAPGDELTVMSFAQMPEQDARGWRPMVAILDEENRIITTKGI